MFQASPRQSVRSASRRAAFLVLLACWMGPASGQDEASAPEGVEFRTRGPVHEAFAAPVSFAAPSGMDAPKAPPAPIEELPPDVRPEGDNVVWIPGYWAWDEASEEFLWVSGVWRNVPPDKTWVPGYWVEVNDLHRWVSGYWQAVEQENVEYLPIPPETQELGPSSPSPGEEWVWIPGSWVWNSGRYVWRPGYWFEANPSWVWVPDRYVWTPGGCIFVAGYWDYQLDDRGVLFSPVHFTSTVYVEPSYRYTPSVVIGLGVFTDHLFCHTGGSHYYFGDYYSSHCADLGYLPWFHYHNHRHGYDPIYAHECRRHGRRNDHRWKKNIEDAFDTRRKDEGRRPPHTFAEAKDLSKLIDPSKDAGVRIGNRIEDLVGSTSKSDGSGRFKTLTASDKNEIAGQRKNLLDYGKFRAQHESTEAGKPGKQVFQFPQHRQPTGSSAKKTLQDLRIEDFQAPSRIPVPGNTNININTNPGANPNKPFRSYQNILTPPSQSDRGTFNQFGGNRGFGVGNQNRFQPKGGGNAVIQQKVLPPSPAAPSPGKSSVRSLNVPGTEKYPGGSPNKGGSNRKNRGR